MFESGVSLELHEANTREEISNKVENVEHDVQIPKARPLAERVRSRKSAVAKQCCTSALVHGISQSTAVESPIRLCSQ